MQVKSLLTVYLRPLPDYTWQLDHVYDVIKAALPGLHGWVDQRLAARKR